MHFFAVKKDRSDPQVLPGASMINAQKAKSTVSNKAEIQLFH